MARGRDCIICGVRLDRNSPIKASLILNLCLIRAKGFNAVAITDLDGLIWDWMNMPRWHSWRNGKKKSKRREKKGKKVEIMIVFFVCFVCWNYFWFAGVRRVCYARIPPLSLRFDMTFMDKHDSQTFIIWHVHIYHVTQAYLSNDVCTFIMWHVYGIWV